MTDPTDEQWSQIESHLYAGQKIAAIKVFREATGSGLKEAKDALDQHEHALRESHPERFTAPAKSGCGASVILFALSASAFLVFAILT